MQLCERGPFLFYEKKVTCQFVLLKRREKKRVIKHKNLSLNVVQNNNLLVGSARCYFIACLVKMHFENTTICLECLLQCTILSKKYCFSLVVSYYYPITFVSQTFNTSSKLPEANKRASGLKEME